MKQAEIIQSTINREQLMSTGMEKGLAVPHCRTISQKTHFDNGDSS